jgi:hypothetical protein
MDFLLEITKVWQKSRDVWFTDFFLEILNTHDMHFPMDLVVLQLLFEVITNFKFD